MSPVFVLQTVRKFQEFMYYDQTSEDMSTYASGGGHLRQPQHNTPLGFHYLSMYLWGL